MAEDERNAGSGDFQPTLTDTLFSSLKLPEILGEATGLRILLEETLTSLLKREALSDEDLKGIFESTGQRISVGAERSKQEVYERLKEEGYPQSYVEEVIDRSKKSAEEILSGIRKRVTNEPDQ